MVNLYIKMVKLEIEVIKGKVDPANQMASYQVDGLSGATSRVEVLQTCSFTGLEKAAIKKH